MSACGLYEHHRSIERPLRSLPPREMVCSIRESRAVFAQKCLDSFEISCCQLIFGRNECLVDIQHFVTLQVADAVVRRLQDPRLSFSLEVILAVGDVAASSIQSARFSTNEFFYSFSFGFSFLDRPSSVAASPTGPRQKMGNLNFPFLIPIKRFGAAGWHSTWVACASLKSHSNALLRFSAPPARRSALPPLRTRRDRHRLLSECHVQDAWQ